MEFRIVDRWNSYLDRIPSEKKDIYYTEEYTKLYESDVDRALCIVGEDDESIILMPFLRRKIRDGYDFETAYGYGGPISNSSSNLWIAKALREMDDYFKGANYICGFIRFHPLMQNALLCKECFNVIYDRKTIAIDMRCSKDEIWINQITSKNRNMIRKAEKNGLIYKAEYDFGSLQQFIELYNDTMQRLGVDEFYFFSERYYHQFADSLKGNAFLGTVSLGGGEIIAAALFMKSGEYGHYHLAGSNRGKGSLGINNFLLWKTIEEMKGTTVKQFHLGGGTGSSKDDSLFKFKRSFSNHEMDFYIGKWIFDEVMYQDICNEWEIKNPGIKDKYKNILLKYRYIK